MAQKTIKSLHHFNKNWNLYIEGESSMPFFYIVNAMEKHLKSI